MEKSVVVRTREYEMLVAQLSPEESRIVSDLLTTQQVPSEVIPDDITPEDLWMKLTATARAVVRIQEAVGKLKPMLGRMLVLLQAHPQLFKNLGYETFNDFMTRGCWELFQVSRPEAFACKRVAEEIGDRMTPEELSTMGFTKANLVATAIRRRIGDGVPAETREKAIADWIERGQNSTLVQLREQVNTELMLDPGELEMEVLTLNLKKNVRDRYMAWRKQDFVRERAGASTDSAILDAMLMECATWEAEYQQKVD